MCTPTTFDWRAKGTICNQYFCILLITSKHNFTCIENTVNENATILIMKLKIFGPFYKCFDIK